MSIFRKLPVYHRLPKICSPFLHTTLTQNWEVGVCSNIQFVSGHTSLPPFLTIYMHKVNTRKWLPLFSGRTAASVLVLLSTTEVYFRALSCYTLTGTNQRLVLCIPVLYNVQCLNHSTVVDNLVREACEHPHYPLNFVQSRYLKGQRTGVCCREYS